MKTYDNDVKTDLNRDPITGEPGSHPVGTTVGATGGAVAGATIGAVVGGPVGAVVGGAIGAVAGGAAGHGAAEVVNPTIEDAYWRDNYSKASYVERNRPYGDYQNAYKYGWESRSTYPNKNWNDVENDLERGWDRAKGESNLAWHQAKSATKDAWHRVERAIPGDADGDGR